MFKIYQEKGWDGVARAIGQWVQVFSSEPAVVNDSSPGGAPQERRLASGFSVEKAHRILAWLLTVLMVVEAVALYLKASRRPFWYDELLTFHVSGLRPFSTLWEALKSGVDGMPPGYYLMVQLARLLPGDPHVTLRLPSILGYLLTLVGVYWFTGNRLSAAVRLIPVLLITLSPLRLMAVEARSYALLVGFVAMAAVCWQRIDEKPWMSWLFGLFLALAVSCHYLVVFIIAVFGLAELVWSWQARKIRWGSWVACVWAAAPFFIGLPILLCLKESVGAHFWSQAVWGMAVSTYSEYLGLEAALNLALVLLLAGRLVAESRWLLKKPVHETGAAGFRLPEIGLLLALLFYPVLLVTLTKLAHSGYVPRYGWPAVFALVVGVGFLFRSAGRMAVAFLCVLLMAYVYLVSLELSKRPKAISTVMQDRWSGLAAAVRNEPELPVVVSNGLAYHEAAYYSPPEISRRMIYVTDSHLAVRFTGSDSTDKLNFQLAQFVPVPVVERPAFEAAYQRFYLCNGGRWDWLGLHLAEAGYHLVLQGIYGKNALYLVDKPPVAP